MLGAGRPWQRSMGLLKLTVYRFGEVTDEQAMQRVRQDGDPEAFAELVRRWERPIQGLCGRMTGDAHEGEDLTQEVFARVFARRKDYEPGRKFSTWLWRIALNLCHDQRRRVSRRGEVELEDEEFEGPRIQAFEPGPDEQLDAQERAAGVRAALLNLPETHRAVLVLREYEGLKLREIAEVLGVPEGTVKSRIADALSRLSRRLTRFRNHEFAAGAGQVPPVEMKSIL
jgi:RNA polymerase sigma-70 factor, ECF subfamily